MSLMNDLNDEELIKEDEEIFEQISLDINQNQDSYETEVEEQEDTT